MAFEVDYFTLTLTDQTHSYVTLAGMPTDSSNVAMDICGGTAQLLRSGDGDFRVDTTSFSPVGAVRWDTANEALNGILLAGDKIRIIYDRS